MALMNETRSVLEQEFITAWGGLTQLAYDNVPFDDNDPTITEYCEIRFLPYENSNASIGDALTRIEGALVIAIYTKYGTGTGRAYELADLVDTNMTNKCYPPGITTRVSDTRRNGDTSEGWFGLLTSIPFVSDECRI